MENIIKKYFWLVPVLAISLCSFFAARAATHYIESKYLPDQKPKPLVAKVAKEAPKKVRTKDGEALATRNMFCSECVIVEEVAQSDTGVSDPNNPPNTSLPLQLIATNVGDRPQQSFATVLNTSNERQGAYNQGQNIPDGGEVRVVHHRYVDFFNDKSRRVERIELFADAAPKKKAETKSAAPKTSALSPKNALMAEVDEGIQKLSDTEFVLDRKVVNKVLENPASIAKGARIVPSIKDGKSNGFKLYAIRPSSIYSKLGLKNGDTIHSINGFELSSPDKALEVYMKLRESSSLSVNATRRGKPVSMSYSIK